MSNSIDGLPKMERFPGLKSGKAIKKSNFAQTCNLLSQYLKEKGTFGDLSLGMTGIMETKGRPETSRPTTTKNLLPNMEKSADYISGQNGGVPSSNLKSLDFFPQFAGFGSSDSVEDFTSKADLRKPAKTEPEAAQMTIFYGGKVLVFDDFPADKAREIMALAGKGNSSHISNHLPYTPTPFHVMNSTNPTQDCLQPQPVQPIVSDMPIVRKNSLHRFLEKRKDRSTARAPYQVNKPFAAPPKHVEGNSSTKMEARSSEHLELKL